MTLDTKSKMASFRLAFEAEHARREADRIAREDAERAQQEADHQRATQLYETLIADADFLEEKGLVVELTRYSVNIDHKDFRLRAYFEAGEINVTAADKRTATLPSAAPRKQQVVTSSHDALVVLAQFLADEIH
jgi:hypothetical protein